MFCSGNAITQICLQKLLAFPKPYATIKNRETNGSMSEWLMETDCKSVAKATLVQIQLGPSHYKLLVLILD